MLEVTKEIEELKAAAGWNDETMQFLAYCFIVELGKEKEFFLYLKQIADNEKRQLEVEGNENE